MVRTLISCTCWCWRYKHLEERVCLVRCCFNWPGNDFVGRNPIPGCEWIHSIQRRNFRFCFSITIERLSNEGKPMDTVKNLGHRLLVLNYLSRRSSLLFSLVSLLTAPRSFKNFIKIGFH